MRYVGKHIRVRQATDDNMANNNNNIIIIIIIIIIINCNWVVTPWQWLIYIYTKYEIALHVGYLKPQTHT